MARVERVALFLASANRDQEVFEDPDLFRIRERERGHLAFVAGNRFCLGANLARAEARAAMNAVITEFPSLELTADRFDYVVFPQVRQLAALPVRWDPAGAAA